MGFFDSIFKVTDEKIDYLVPLIHLVDNFYSTYSSNSQLKYFSLIPSSSYSTSRIHQYILSDEFFEYDFENWKFLQDFDDFFWDTTLGYSDYDSSYRSSYRSNVREKLL